MHNVKSLGGRGDYYEGPRQSHNRNLHSLVTVGCCLKHVFASGATLSLRPPQLAWPKEMDAAKAAIPEKLS